VLRALLAGGYLPVVSSIGIDAAGGLLNLNADDAAAGIAGVVGASRLVLLTDVTGIKGGDGRVRPTLTGSAVEAMIASGEVTGGMIVKARSAVNAARATGAAVVILSGETPEALTRHLAGEAVGTTISA
jgi:acetylglutamate kinase